MKCPAQAIDGFLPGFLRHAVNLPVPEQRAQDPRLLLPATLLRSEAARYEPVFRNPVRFVSWIRIFHLRTPPLKNSGELAMLS